MGAPKLTPIICPAQPPSIRSRNSARLIRRVSAIVNPAAAIDSNIIQVRVRIFASYNVAAPISSSPPAYAANMNPISAPVPCGAPRNSFQISTPQIAATSVAPCPRA